MVKKVILWLVALNIVALLVWGVVSRLRSQSEDKQVTFTAQKLQDVKKKKKDDYIKLQQVTAACQKSGTISDADLDWAIHLLKSKPIVATNGSLLHSNVLNLFLNLQNLSVEQENQIYDATVPLLSVHESGDEDYGLNQQFALQVIGHIKDRRAIPVILPLLSDPRRGVQLTASRTLAKLGYAIKSEQPKV